ncbi:Aste57867_875 [Aphanomyces stellatus]|uniref:Aste57867_875 protein n=1 Tax=Aphanomyces stellatus TaxID=120398 RepID=A0A485K4S2_9STRA|nr:hypothetical protein As57867_000874 [Aphanomyces stellatus]VFT78099.1 Aste57867_875 [Aphanomyces stellatus]
MQISPMVCPIAVDGLNSVLQDLKLASSNLAQATEVLNEQGRAMEAKKLEWAAMSDRIATHVATATDFITLNVGGIAFIKPKATLLKHKGGYFHAMLGSGYWKPDVPVDSYFLDVEPTTFHRVLAYLPSGELSFEGLNAWEHRQLYVKPWIILAWKSQKMR